MGIEILNTTRITTGYTFTSSYATITGMDQTLTIAGTSSLVLFLADISVSGGSDAEGIIGLFIDDVLQCENIAFCDDNTNEQGHISLAWWDTGLSAATHTFRCKAKDGAQTGAIVYTGESIEHTMQVIEFTGSDAPTIIKTVEAQKRSSNY